MVQQCIHTSKNDLNGTTTSKSQLSKQEYQQQQFRRMNLQREKGQIEEVKQIQTYNSQSSLSSRFAQNYQNKRKWTSASPVIIDNSQNNCNQSIGLIQTDRPKFQNKESYVRSQSNQDNFDQNLMYKSDLQHTARSQINKQLSRIEKRSSRSRDRQIQSSLYLQEQIPLLNNMVENKMPINIDTNTNLKHRKVRQSKNAHNKKQNGDLAEEYINKQQIYNIVPISNGKDNLKNNEGIKVFKNQKKTQTATFRSLSETQISALEYQNKNMKTDINEYHLSNNDENQERDFERFESLDNKQNQRTRKETEQSFISKTAKRIALQQKIQNQNKINYESMEVINQYSLENPLFLRHNNQELNKKNEYLNSIDFNNVNQYDNANQYLPSQPDDQRYILPNHNLQSQFHTIQQNSFDHENQKSHYQNQFQSLKDSQSVNNQDFFNQQNPQTDSQKKQNKIGQILQSNLKILKEEHIKPESKINTREEKQKNQNQKNITIQNHNQIQTQRTESGQTNWNDRDLLKEHPIINIKTQQHYDKLIQNRDMPRQISSQLFDSTPSLIQSHQQFEEMQDKNKNILLSYNSSNQFPTFQHNSKNVVTQSQNSSDIKQEQGIIINENRNIILQIPETQMNFGIKKQKYANLSVSMQENMPLNFQESSNLFQERYNNSLNLMNDGNHKIIQCSVLDSINNSSFAPLDYQDQQYQESQLFNQQFYNQNSNFQSHQNSKGQTLIYKDEEYKKLKQDQSERVQPKKQLSEHDIQKILFSKRVSVNSSSIQSQQDETKRSNISVKPPSGISSKQIMTPAATLHNIENNVLCTHRPSSNVKNFTNIHLKSSSQTNVKQRMNHSKIDNDNANLQNQYFNGQSNMINQQNNYQIRNNDQLSIGSVNLKQRSNQQIELKEQNQSHKHKKQSRSRQLKKEKQNLSQSLNIKN